MKLGYYDLNVAEFNAHYCLLMEKVNFYINPKIAKCAFNFVYEYVITPYASEEYKERRKENIINILTEILDYGTMSRGIFRDEHIMEAALEYVVLNASTFALEFESGFEVPFSKKDFEVFSDKYVARILSLSEVAEEKIIKILRNKKSMRKMALKNRKNNYNYGYFLALVSLLDLVVDLY